MVGRVAKRIQITQRRRLRFQLALACQRMSIQDRRNTRILRCPCDDEKVSASTRCNRSLSPTCALVTTRHHENRNVTTQDLFAATSVHRSRSFCCPTAFQLEWPRHKSIGDRSGGSRNVCSRLETYNAGQLERSASGNPFVNRSPRAHDVMISTIHICRAGWTNSLTMGAS